MRTWVAVPVVLVLCAACGGGGSDGADTGTLGDHLSVVPAAGAKEPKCEGTFAPGQSVEVSDPRFAATASVTLTVTPSGGTPMTSTLFADPGGGIKTTIRLPQTPGSVYITATGVSATGTQTNDTAGIVVLAADSPCEEPG